MVGQADVVRFFYQWQWQREEVLMVVVTPQQVVGVVRHLIEEFEIAVL